MPRTSTLICTALLAVGLITLASCSSDNGDKTASPPSNEATVTSPSTAAESPSTTTETSSNGNNSEQCETLEERDDGRYDLGDAGTVVVRHEGSELILVDIEEATGWTSEVDDDDDLDEVEIDLRSDDGAKVEFEAEIADSGRLKIEVCVRG